MGCAALGTRRGLAEPAAAPTRPVGPVPRGSRARRPACTQPTTSGPPHRPSHLKIVIGVVGAVLVIGGLIMVPFPGPGWLVVFAGLACWPPSFTGPTAAGVRASDCRPGRPWLGRRGWTVKIWSSGRRGHRRSHRLLRPQAQLRPRPGRRGAEAPPPLDGPRASRGPAPTSFTRGVRLVIFPGCDLRSVSTSDPQGRIGRDD
ncbi:PGPGW domain-containing protein [Streptosporangium longisporum]|uniref:PGPGW domain-containing protein n=1 Tax=Streptosporangium longisporum TaxID=46187 RepID=UPI003CD0966A